MQLLLLNDAYASKAWYFGCFLSGRLESSLFFTVVGNINTQHCMNLRIQAFSPFISPHLRAVCLTQLRGLGTISYGSRVRASPFLLKMMFEFSCLAEGLSFRYTTLNTPSSRSPLDPLCSTSSFQIALLQPSLHLKMYIIVCPCFLNFSVTPLQGARTVNYLSNSMLSFCGQNILNGFIR